jgi:hypothetical protein
MAYKDPTDEVPMRYMIAALLTLTIAALGCPAAGTPQGVQGPGGVAAQPGQSGAALGAAAGPTLTPPDQISPERRVSAYIDGVSRTMEIDEARSLGFTIVDLSDDWVPYIFWSRTPGKDDYKVNRYLDTYVDLANDRIDVDGVALQSWEHNYHEVYGIPPSLGVLRKRFVEEEQRPCFKELDGAFLVEAYHGPVRVGEPKASERLDRRYKALRRDYKKALRKARVRTLEALLAKRKYRKLAERYQRVRWQHRAIRAMQKRLACEKMFGRRTPRLKPGVVNWAVRQALRRFERKNNVYGWGLIFQNTAVALGRSPRQNNFEALKRTLTERVVSAAGIVEDGTIRRGRYKGADGRALRVRNLVQEFSEAALRQLGLTTPERALAFIKSRSSFKRFFVALKLPRLPEYYKDQMELSAEYDRGDVWYDFPFNDKGKRKNQPRSRFPHVTLYVTHEGQKIPLVYWRTTIGGWQPEIRHDEEYYKYKISDVGPRIWKKIVAGPVWVPPKNTPSRDMVKIRPVRGRSQRIVAHQSFGPGYASAYGLVAAYHVSKGGRDNQVRTHGTHNYMSIKSSGGFSHGCHRLFNFRAVRLFSFVLRHRNFIRHGQHRLNMARKYEHRGEEFQMDLPTRGYRYELTPPVPVLVHEGRVRGTLQEPEEKYIKKPTGLYQDDVKSTHKGTTGAPRVNPKDPGSLIKQPQDL